MIGIYKIESPSGKIYIGQSIDIERRFKKYQSGNITKVQPKLFNSFVKYGVSNHTYEVLEECSTDILTDREKFWITKFDSTVKGLNVRQAGSKGRLADSTKEKISKALTGRQITWGDKIGKKNKGQKRTNHTKQVLSKNKTEYWKNRYSELYENASNIISEYENGFSKRKLMLKYGVGYDTLTRILNYL